MTLTTCTTYGDEAVCEADAKCVWGVTEDCNDAQQVVTANECNVHLAPFFETLAAGSCDADTAIFATVFKMEADCTASATESACVAVSSQTVAAKDCEGDADGCGPHRLTAAVAAVAGAALCAGA